MILVSAALPTEKVLRIWFFALDPAGLKKVLPPYFQSAQPVDNICFVSIDAYKPLQIAENLQIYRFQISSALTRIRCQKWGFCNFYSFWAIQLGTLPSLRVLNSLATLFFDDATQQQHKLAFLCPEISWAAN